MVEFLEVPRYPLSEPPEIGRNVEHIRLVVLKAPVEYPARMHRAADIFVSHKRLGDVLHDLGCDADVVFGQHGMEVGLRYRNSLHIGADLLQAKFREFKNETIDVNEEYLGLPVRPRNLVRHIRQARTIVNDNGSFVDNIGQEICDALRAEVDALLLFLAGEFSSDKIMDISPFTLLEVSAKFPEIRGF